MGKFSDGIWGNFYGKIGNVVGSSWRGIDYLRRLPRLNKDRVPSQRQMEQQAKFGLMTGFLSLVRPVLEIGYKNLAVEATAYNVALSDNIRNGIAGAYPDFEIDFSMITLSRGLLPQVTLPGAAAAAGLKVDFSWTNNTGKGKAAAKDTVVALVYSPELNDYEYSHAQSKREDASLSMTLPPDFAGKEVETYMFLVSENGKLISDTAYTGKLTVIA